MSINKKEVFHKCLDIVDQRISWYNEKMEDISDQNSIKNFAPGPDFYGNPGQLMTEFEKSADELDRVQKYKQDLANLDIDNRSRVIRPGSVVETEKGYYFVSVPLGEIEMDDGSKVYAISTKAPIYEHLEGKEEGDSFIFNDKKIEIKKIH